MDALMHYRQFCRNFIYSRPRKLRKIYSTSPWLIWIFRGGGRSLPLRYGVMRKAQKHYLLLIFMKHDKEKSQA